MLLTMDQTEVTKKQFFIDMKTINEVTSSLNAIHLYNQNEWNKNDMEVDEIDNKMFDEERKTYEIYVDCCSEEADKWMEVYLSIMSDVVGGHANAIAVLEGNMHGMSCFFVNLTRAELDKLVEVDHDRIRGIYPPYKPL
ncbi:hypothetical protein QVD17_42129 [Tagetes erecta]|uniref:Uncharacterized protein n=1 Tax=Tagetes erecta TaxID=13708 RepID=A0AAD8JLD4_TARER|nr:hypothetical protein QVD17_42129 [Tagetes erecta]